MKYKMSLTIVDVDNFCKDNLFTMSDKVREDVTNLTGLDVSPEALVEISEIILENSLNPNYSTPKELAIDLVRAGHIYLSL